MPKTKRAKPIVRQLVRTELEEIRLWDLGASLKELHTTIDGLIAKYGPDTQVEFDGPEYEGIDHMKVYIMSMETDEQFAKRKKKVLQARKAALASAKKRALRATQSQQIEDQVRERSLKAAAEEQNVVDAVNAARLREPFAK